MTRTRIPEIIPEPSVGDRCGLSPCVNVHGSQLTNGNGFCHLTAYKNGAHWILICSTCAHDAAQRIIDRPIAPPKFRAKKIVLHGVRQERLL